MFWGLFCGLFVFVFVFSHEGARFPLNIFLSAMKKPRPEGHQTSVFRYELHGLNFSLAYVDILISVR